MFGYQYIGKSPFFKKELIKAFTVASCMMFSASLAFAGKITSQATEDGTPGFSGFNQQNIEVVLDGDSSFYIPETGVYEFGIDSDFSYESIVYDTNQLIMGKALAKDWPVGEPSGIKIVNDDFDGNKRKATNCIMSTSYLEDHYLDSEMPIQVICSSPYQSHKRYKLAMLPNSVEDGGAVDLVFNVTEELGSRDYQVFQKINNWTDTRLQGFTTQLGFGVGTAFEAVTDYVGVDDEKVSLADLNISVPNNIWDAEQLVIFSAGLFGPLDKHSGEYGYFDNTTRAGFFIDEYIIADPDLDPDAVIDPEALPILLDTLHGTTPLGSNYSELFGRWLPNTMVPWGIFFDDDNDPSTDAELLAWYGAYPDSASLAWRGGGADGFEPFTDDEITTMSNNLAYTTGEIDDLVNVGLNYNVTIGDISLFPDYDSNLKAATFTIRIIPTKDTSGMGAPSFVDVEPFPALIFTSSDAVVELQPLPTFYVGDLLTARVGDADLNTDPVVAEEVVVSISTDSGLSDQLILIEQGENRGVFAAALPDEYINVEVGTVVTLTYTELDNGTVVDVETPVVKTSSTTAVAAGTLDFESVAYQVIEDDGTVEIIVQRTEGTLGEVSVDYSTVSGSAIGNEDDEAVAYAATGNKDYEPMTGTLIFKAGEQYKSIEIIILEDLIAEQPETFSVLLSNTANGALLGDDYIAYVTIEDAVIEDAVIESSSSGGSMAMWNLLLMALLISIKKIVKK